MTTPTHGRVFLERHGEVAEIVIDRSPKLNGFTPAMLGDIARAYTEFENDAGLRCAVLTAAGPHFTAGLDLPAMAPVMAENGLLIPDGMIDPLMTRPPFRTKPVVAAVKGITYTIGMELMLAADIVIAADNCRFSQLEVKRGLMPTGGATLRFVERAGWGNAMLHLLTGDEFGPAEAWRCGFIQEIVPAGTERDRAMAIAQVIAVQAPLAVAAVLANARKAVWEGQSAAVGDFTPVQARLLASDDLKEGVRSFVEKRPAKFTGR